MMRIFSGTLRQRELVLPKTLDFRPTTSKLRMQVFNICQHMVEGARVLDLFARSGSIGFEAISRGAAHCTFVEKERAIASSLLQNIEKLCLKNTCTVLPGDALSAIKKLSPSQPFSLVYIDPPYDLVETPFFQEVLSAIDQSQLIEKGGTLFIESRKNSLTLPSFSSLSLQSRRRSGQSELWQYTSTNRIASK